jgi:hypothetical protein
MGDVYLTIVLFSGKAEAGKSLSVSLLKTMLEAQGKRVAIIPYGDYVKHTARLVWGWDGRKDAAGRQLLQWWGTDVARAKEPDFWAMTAVRLAKLLDGIVDYILIDDARYPNEITCWNCCGCLTVRVERPDHENALTPEQRQHISETSLDNWPFDVTISATDRQELEAQIRDKVLDRLISKTEGGT